MKKKYLALASVFIASFTLSIIYGDLVFSQTVPTESDIAKIYNIEKAEGRPVDVRYLRDGECPVETWCRVKTSNQRLFAEDWLQTGTVSRADLAVLLVDETLREVLFWQQEGSLSRFVPKAGTCHFQIEEGKFLYLHPNQSTQKGCDVINAKYARIFPQSSLFIDQTKDRTVAGVLSSGSSGQILVQSRVGRQDVSLRVGELAIAFADGTLRKEPFSLKDFYRKNRQLTVGLGDESSDNQYVAKQEPGIRKILDKIRDDIKLAIIRPQPHGTGTLPKREPAPIAGPPGPVEPQPPNPPPPGLPPPAGPGGSLVPPTSGPSLIEVKPIVVTLPRFDPTVIKVNPPPLPIK